MYSPLLSAVAACHDQLTEDMEASFLCGGCGESQRGKSGPWNGAVPRLLIRENDPVYLQDTETLDPGESREE